MGGKSTPDFGNVAASQGEENRKVVQDQLYANRPDQYTPWGYTNWTTEQIPDGQGGFTDKWSQTQGLTPEMQNELYKQQAIQSGKSDVAGGLVGRMGEEFGEGIDWSGLNPMGGVPEAQYTRPEGDVGDPNAYRQRAEDAVYHKGAKRLDDRFEGMRRNMEIKLRNQGLGPEDQAYKDQMQGIAQTSNDAYGNLQSDAVTQGRNESDSMFGQQIQRGNQNFGQNMSSNQQNFQQGMNQSAYANTIRQQQMTEAMQQRGFSLNEINALMSGQQVQNPQMPNFAQGQAAQPAPIYQGAVDASNIEQMQGQGVLGGVTGLAGAGINAYGMSQIGK